jgi:hypothetical protein
MRAELQDTEWRSGALRRSLLAARLLAPPHFQRREAVGCEGNNRSVTAALPTALEPIEFEVRLLHARLDRADEHCRSFGRIWAGYLDQRPHALDRSTEPDGTIVARLRRSIPLPAELSVVFGELLYELRAALDNCLYAVAVLVSGQNPPPSAARLEWPIRETRSEWDSQAARYRDLPSEITEALQAIQPYQAQLPDWNSLRILHNLARVDRHRTPHGLGLYLSHLRARVDPDLVEVVNAGRPGIVHEGDEIMRVRIADGVRLAPENFDLDLEFDVDVTDVGESIGPSGASSRPWGPLDKRLYSLIKAVDEYTSGLLAIAADLVEPGPGTDGSDA